MRKLTVVLAFMLLAGSVFAQQYGRPDGDVYVQDWLPLPLYEQINETTPSDADSISSQDPASYDTCQVSLSDVTDPGVGTGHLVRFRWQSREGGGGQPADVDFDLRLMEGTSEIAAGHRDIDPPTTWATDSLVLNTTEANSISDYTDLRIEFVANQASGARTATVDISWAEFECPSVAAYRRRIIISQ